MPLCKFLINKCVLNQNTESRKIKMDIFWTFNYCCKLLNVYESNLLDLHLNLITPLKDKTINQIS